MLICEIFLSYCPEVWQRTWYCLPFSWHLTKYTRNNLFETKGIELSEGERVELSVDGTWRQNVTWRLNKSLLFSHEFFFLGQSLFSRSSYIVKSKSKELVITTDLATEMRFAFSCFREWKLLCTSSQNEVMFSRRIMSIVAKTKLLWRSNPTWCSLSHSWLKRKGVKSPLTSCSNPANKLLYISSSQCCSQENKRQSLYMSRFFHKLQWLL